MRDGVLELRRFRAADAEALAALLADPDVENERAIRSYAAVGFRPVGVLRSYERNPEEGGWNDGLLMDLIVRDGVWS